jgi:DNA-binding response OmpR family regulator
MRILLIASDTARVSQVRSVLLDEDIDLVVNGRGDEGAQSARGLAFDIVLLDPFLPDISGPDVLSRLRKNEVIAPVVVVSDQVGGFRS